MQKNRKKELKSMYEDYLRQKAKKLVILFEKGKIGQVEVNKWLNGA